MLGLVRFLLASVVVANHFYAPVANKVGANAVIAFYMISGYLMARILNQNYGLNVSGILRFWVNRFLRIYPAYWTVLLLSWLGLWLAHDVFAVYGTLMQIPTAASEWFSNITLYELAWSPTITIPPSWSLWVEVFFYITMPLVLARSKRTVMVWLLASLGVTVYLVLSGATFGNRYTPIYAASLFFSMGAAVFYFWDRLVKFKPGWRTGWALLAIFIVFPLVVEGLGGDRFMLGYYGPALLFVPVLVWAIGTRMDSLQMLGDLAYPVFLNHFVAAGFVRLVFGSRIGDPTWFYLVTYGFTVLLALGLHWAVDARVNRVRGKVRRGVAPPAEKPVLELKPVGN